eukprot:scaffold2214_cov139-Cylindrotheca_fusiformis.AAC.26
MARGRDILRVRIENLRLFVATLFLVLVLRTSLFRFIFHTRLLFDEIQSDLGLFRSPLFLEPSYTPCSIVQRNGSFQFLFPIVLWAMKGGTARRSMSSFLLLMKVALVCAIRVRQNMRGEKCAFEKLVLFNQIGHRHKKRIKSF